MTDESTTLQRELTRNTEELEAMSSKNSDMAYVLSTAIPTLRDLLNNVSYR